MCYKGTSDVKGPIRGMVMGSPTEIVTEGKVESGPTREALR